MDLCLKSSSFTSIHASFFVNSSFHDPTGHILSLERRKKIIEISNTYRVPIVEEDAASELVYEGRSCRPSRRSTRWKTSFTSIPSR